MFPPYDNSQMLFIQPAVHGGFAKNPSAIKMLSCCIFTR